MDQKKKELILDRLNRASEMEEEMALMLHDLLNKEKEIKGVPDTAISSIRNMLDYMKNDSLRHKESVEKIISRLGGKNG